MEVPRLGVQLKLHLLACVTVIAIPHMSHVCDLHCSLQQGRILNPLIEARDQTTTSWFLVRFISLSHDGHSHYLLNKVCMDL